MKMKNLRKKQRNAKIMKYFMITITIIGCIMVFGTIGSYDLDLISTKQYTINGLMSCVLTYAGVNGINWTSDRLHKIERRIYRLKQQRKQNIA